MNNVAQLNGWAQISCVQMEHSLLYRAEVRSFPLTSTLCVINLMIGT